MKNLMMKMSIQKGQGQGMEEDEEGEEESDEADEKKKKKKKKSSTSSSGGGGGYEPVKAAVAQVTLMSIAVGVLFYMLGYSSAECPRV